MIQTVVLEEGQRDRQTDQWNRMRTQEETPTKYAHILDKGKGNSVEEGEPLQIVLEQLDIY